MKHEVLKREYYAEVKPETISLNAIYGLRDEQGATNLGVTNSITSSNPGLTGGKRWSRVAVLRLAYIADLARHAYRVHILHL